MVGRLYVIATPIGNFGDISYRAIETLKQCGIIACEDTRVSQNLLKRYDIKADLVPYHDKNELSQAENLKKKILDGVDVGVICDAGTPTISDPGFRLVRECRRLGVEVIPIPGASAITAALSVSGLPSNAFLFLGFPGHKESARVKLLEKYGSLPVTLIFYESCYRVEKFLKNILDILGPDRVVCLAKEITKVYEKFITCTILELIEKLKNMTIKGEFVVLVAADDFKL